MLDLTRNPLFKIIGIIVILYFALFHDKKNPDSLGSRLSSENLKKNFVEVKKRTDFISENIKMAKQYEASHKDQEGLSQDSSSDQNSDSENPEIKPEKINEPIIIDVKNAGILCGDEVEISYKIFHNKKELASIPVEKVVVGSNKNPMIERGIVGMKQGDSKMIAIDSVLPKNATKDLKAKMPSLKYQVTIFSLKRFSKPQFTCE